MLRCTIPEGVEVKLSADLIRPIIKNKIVLSIIPSASGRYKNNLPEGLDHFYTDLYLNCPKINYINVKGKFMYWEFDNDWHMFCTFGMSGQWSPDKGKHPCITINLTDHNTENSIHFNDPRHFGTIRFVKGGKELGEKLSELGWDPLQGEYNRYSYWIKSRIRETNKPIGQILMDQTIFAGVGNYIRAEALYRAKISPWRSSKLMTDQDIDALCHSVVRVMEESYQHQGATIATYKTAYGAEGKYSSCFKVYGKKIDPLGHPIIKEETPEGRTIHWCPTIQL